MYTEAELGIIYDCATKALPGICASMPNSLDDKADCSRPVQHYQATVLVEAAIALGKEMLDQYNELRTENNIPPVK